MKRECTGTLVLLIVGMTFAIGPQHCIFRSQSTQGNHWTGSSSIVSEHYDITVMPSYLDVTLDLTFDCKGTVAPDSFTDALEIVGNMNIAQGAAVTGMLLWNGEEILKAKLKPLQLAREQYEKVVDRDADAPPPPRDPVIFEYGWGEDNYYLSIFPVKWEGSRKLRMRYVIPAINMNGYTDIPFPTAFNTAVATYRITSGTGVSTVAMVNNSGIEKELPVPATFTTKSTLYQSIVMIRPVTESNDQKSRFYTASFNLPGFEGTVTHVIGRTGADILKSAGLREDIVFLWRWNHYQWRDLYINQIIAQAKLLRDFMNRIYHSTKRAGLVVDRSGVNRQVFSIDSTDGSSGKKMLQFLDSLCELPPVKSGPYYNPGFTSVQTDSIIALSLEEFKGSIRLAESMFDLSGEKKINRIIVMTSGPEWIKTIRSAIVTDLDSSIVISPVASLSGTEALEGLAVPSEARQFYWPGINVQSVSRQMALSVEAVLTTRSGKSVTVPVSPINSPYRYYWKTVSPHLDRKLLTSQPLETTLLWKIYKNKTLIAKIPETPEIVNQSDPVQFASALCSSGSVEYPDGQPEASLAATFGFVDKQYALLALEEDVMDPLDQERYRFEGVPALTTTDIVVQPDDNPPDQQKIDQPGTAVQNPLNVKHVEADVLCLTLNQSVLTITIGADKEIATSKKVSIEIYSLTGKLLFCVKKLETANGIIRCVLPQTICSTRQTLIIMVRIGSQLHRLKLISGTQGMTSAGVAIR
jgi:hypothetical protein